MATVLASLLLFLVGSVARPTTVRVRAQSHLPAISRLASRPFRTGLARCRGAQEQRKAQRIAVAAVKQQFDSFDEMLKQFELPVLVDFYADWCGPCKLMESELEIVQTALRDKIQIVKIDTEKHANIAQQHKVYGLPTMALFKNGEQVWRFEGAMRADNLVSEIEAELNKM
uniref:Thioredoxin domain-containing protein n=1 Tax=Lotharella globosa TaxID=91324 RepID=A0A6U3AHA4_9EUKA|mmetsp:Transcript_25032/g.48904  ORF Transcript_25032/g.48904 Transcript_25032/m.48904 type:complete len:171 (-) Transcript_25032:174-686(-)